MRKRRFLQAVLVSGALTASAFAVAPPAFAGNWGVVPCPSATADCTDGAGHFGVGLGYPYLACDSTKTTTVGDDGVLWQNGTGGKTQCHFTGGVKG